MKKAAVFLFLMLLIMAAPAWAQVPDGVIESVKFSVVAIYADPEFRILRGSGFFIASKALVMTNYHVIDQYPRLWGRLYDGKQYEFFRVFPWPDKDMALLLPLLTDSDKAVNFPYLQFAKQNELNMGDSVASIGHSWGGRWQVIQSQITGKVSYRYNDTWSLSPNILGGFSGSPMVNDAGNVVGINTFTADSSKSFKGTNSYAISLNDIRIFMTAYEKNELPPAEKPLKLYHGGTLIENCRWQETKEGQWCRHK